MNRALARWDEWECAQTMADDIRPDVRQPALGRDGLTHLRATPLGVLLDFEAAWERRN